MSLDSVTTKDGPLDSVVDPERKAKLDETFHKTLTEDDLRKQARAFGFELEFDGDTEVASLFRKGDDSKWPLYTGHCSSISPWLHGYGICAIYWGHF